jgi:hypothetical protein
VARGTTLGELVTQLRLKAKLGPDPSLSRNMEPRMQQDLRMEQERLYDDFDWPFLKITADKTISAGERYYDVPTTMNLERIIRVDIKWGSRWVPVERGISTDHYNQHDSDLDVRVDPVRRWDVKDTGSGEQIEVWPVPLTNGLALRFTGIRKLKPLVSLSDIADLDDQMIVGFAAAQMLASKGDADAQLVLQSAKARQTMLQGRVTKTRRNRFGLGTGGLGDECAPTDRTPLVAYVRAP